MSDDTELANPKVKLRKDGTLVQNQDGAEVAVAHYNRTSGHLEFSTKENSVKLYQQVTSRIGSVSGGTQTSGLVIRSIGVKGQAKVSGKLPPKPKMGRAGDAGEEIVQWYLDNDMPQAIVRYGIYTDANGKPVRKNVRRVMDVTQDNRELDDEDIEQVRDGRNTKTKAPVSRRSEVIEEKNAIIARRATPLTFTPQEVVGGWQPDDDFEEQPIGVGDEGGAE